MKRETYETAVRPVVWLAGLLTGAVVIAAATIAGWWFVPFVAGLGAGLANRAGNWPVRVAVPAVAAMAAVGWGVPLWHSGRHVGRYAELARIAALTGLPRSVAAGLLLTVLVAVVQAVTGYWLGRAVTPRVADDLFR